MNTAAAPAVRRTDDREKCPFCMTAMHADATVCAACGATRTAKAKGTKGALKQLAWIATALAIAIVIGPIGLILIGIPAILIAGLYTFWRDRNRDTWKR